MVRDPVTAYIALGANLGDPAAALLQAMDDMDNIKGISLISRSCLYRTAPIASSGPDYVNAVVEILTVLTAPALLVQMQQLENLAGRERPFFNAPRTLDLDVLLYGDAQIESQSLIIPHPRMNERAFVLVPLAEIAPTLVKPEQLRLISDQSIVRMDTL